MIETILLAFLAAKLKGCKLKPLFKSWTIYLIMCFVVTYVYFQIRIFQADYYFIRFTNIFKILFLCSFITLIIQYKRYLAGLVGAGFVVLGSILNTIVMSANGGKMPVYPTLSYITGYIKPDTLVKADNLHVLGSEATKLKYLTDFIDLGYSLLSIGDVLVRVFAFLVVYHSIKYINQQLYNTSR